MGKGIYYCPNCGYSGKNRAIIRCPICGHDMTVIPVSRKENNKNKMNPIFSTETETEVLVADKIEIKEQHDLIIYNDDVNTFDHVIESLCEICKHNSLQAEQCALIIHYNGKCSVKRGEYDKLRPMCEALLERKLSAVIE